MCNHVRVCLRTPTWQEAAEGGVEHTRAVGSVQGWGAALARGIVGKASVVFQLGRWGAGRPSLRRLMEGCGGFLAGALAPAAIARVV